MTNLNIPKDISSHKFRHTHISLLAQAGVPLAEIQERVGHENSLITQRIYLHMTPERKRNAVEKLERLLREIDG